MEEKLIKEVEFTADVDTYPVFNYKGKKTGNMVYLKRKDWPEGTRFGVFIPLGQPGKLLTKPLVIERVSRN